MASVQQLRLLDELAVSQYQMHSLQLMENAGAGAARWIVQNVQPCKCLILCGAGNNGGDGYVVARHLDFFGFKVQVFVLADQSRIKGDALHNLRIIQAMKLPVEFLPDLETIGSTISSLTDCDVLLDAILGTGSTLPLRGNISEVLKLTKGSRALPISLDIPTGMDSDTGRVEDVCFRAKHTLSFAALKDGFSSEGAESWTGQTTVIPIGIPKALMATVLG